MTRVVAIADSDSYLKWSSALLASLPDDWQRAQWVVRTPITPSAAQIAAAAGVPDSTAPGATAPDSTASGATAPGQIIPRGFATLMADLARTRPDVVVLACTGPVVQAFLEYPLLRGRNRPVLVTGLPGISVPATRRAVRFRSGMDLFVIASERERADFAELGRLHGEDTEFVVSRLPFLPAREAARPVGGGDVVFATQAKVPTLAHERVGVLDALAHLPDGLHGVVKVRALAGEQQTHHEALSYADLWNEGVAARRWHGNELMFRAGSMRDALETAAGFVTVSSTAALEAIALGVPTLILADFGVSEEMINLVFEGSGLLGTLDDLRQGRFRTADPAWLAANYFHDDAHNDWRLRLSELVAQRDRGPLPYRRFSPMGRYRGRVRRQLRVLAPGWAPSAARTAAARLQSH